MGAGISLSTSNKYDDDDGDGRPGLGDIPESCISRLLMNLDPPEICQLARVNRTFHRASSADFVWESKLPQSYKFLATKVFGQDNIIASMTKKDIYTNYVYPIASMLAPRKFGWINAADKFVCSCHPSPST
ncbi:hypothetical protein HN51_057079 [Arachis hypogaea]|uniref:F-box protein n=1 Tax=Arachis hypogaea TaxID=3818 RepID=A0A6B9VEH1_ARAHY|nr:F-box protein [Arachis hypogaea]